MANHDQWQEFVDRLYRQNEFAIKLGLDAISAALDAEGRPDASHRDILVAGTNGKGETAAFLASILSAHGLRVGLFTSPHLLDFRERFRVDGALMDRDEILEVGQYVMARYADEDRPDRRLTFFELATLMAALAFEQRQVDVGVYEVGLGGRLDATNALQAELSVVTSISVDHSQYLGTTPAEVAGEKAGIFRAGRAAVVGRQVYPEARQVLAAQAPEGALFYGRDYGYDRDCPAGDLRLSNPDMSVSFDKSLPPVRRWNAACAAQAASRFLGDTLDHQRLRQGLRATRWPGRLDMRRLPSGADGSDRYFFDVAHNPEAARLLVEHIDRAGIEVGAVICGAMKDKDLAGLFAPIDEGWPIFAALVDSARAAGQGQLREALADKNLCQVGPTSAMVEAARRAVDDAAEQAPILVFGSAYLVGECFEELAVSPDDLVTTVGLSH